MEIIYFSICVLVVGLLLYQLKLKRPIHDWYKDRKFAQHKKEEFRQLVAIEKEKLLCHGVEFTTERDGSLDGEVMTLSAHDWRDSRSYDAIWDKAQRSSWRADMFTRYYAHVNTLAESRAEKILHERTHCPVPHFGAGIQPPCPDPATTPSEETPDWHTAIWTDLYKNPTESLPHCLNFGLKNAHPGTLVAVMKDLKGGVGQRWLGDFLFSKEDIIKKLRDESINFFGEALLAVYRRDIHGSGSLVWDAREEGLVFERQKNRMTQRKT